MGHLDFPPLTRLDYLVKTPTHLIWHLVVYKEVIFPGDLQKQKNTTIIGKFLNKGVVKQTTIKITNNKGQPTNAMYSTR